jgi:hypothetical protein
MKYKNNNNNNIYIITNGYKGYHPYLFFSLSGCESIWLPIFHKGVVKKRDSLPKGGVFGKFFV